MLSVITYIDIFIAGVAMVVLFVLYGKHTNGYTRPYFVVPAALIWVHVVGNALQEMELGPVWVQNHLHDVGVATLGVILMTPFASFAVKENTRSFTQTLMKYTMAAHFAATVLCVLYKVYQVTIDRETTLAEGYSGDLDVGDITAFVVGLTVMGGNHLVMKRHVLSKMRNAEHVNAF